MDGKRPQGRQKYVSSGSSSGVHKRGSGLGTGPVGNGSTPSGSSGGSGGGSGRVTRSGGRSPLMLIVLLAVLLLGGGGGALSSILGGSSEDYGVTQSALDNITQAQTVQATPQATTAGSSNFSGVQKPDNSVAAGSRGKYTEILGNGQDEVLLMVYMCGTDLESKHSMATKDLMEMTKANLGSNVHVVVYTGGCSRWNNQVISSSVNQIYEVANGGLKQLEKDMGSDPMTRSSTLSTFIKWCNQHYSGNRKGLILWDHGGGSVSGYGYDEKNARSGSMSLAGIQQALQDADTKFDFIGFDACLMATVENGLMLGSYADYMIASEETEPGIGWYYTNWLTSLSKNTSMSTVELGKSIVDDFVSTCGTECRGQSATLSVVDLAELSNTAPAPLKDFSGSLSTLISNKEYQQISNARNGAREYARSSAIDQIDLVDFAGRVGTDEGKALCEALLGAVKYNRTSSNMAAGSNGLSIYFPYRKASNVDTAVKTYSAIGMDESYSRAIQEFASLEVSGQVSTGGTASPMSSLFGSLGGSASGSSSADMISGLLGSFLSSDFSSISGLSGSNTGFLSGRSLSTEETADYISNHYFDGSQLTWTKNKNGDQVIAIPEDQWALVESLDLNLFFDDGEGYVDLGLDNVFDFDGDGNLLAATDRTWLALNGQIVAYYHEYTLGEGDDAVTSGYIPVMLNGERAELLVVFDGEHPRGAVTGARYVYVNGETDTVAKSMTELQEGDTLDFLCDYYSYDGAYQDSYYLGEPMTVSGAMELSNMDVGEGNVRMTYRFTDLYQQHYWTESIIE